jgi:hypothetical protein
MEGPTQQVRLIRTNSPWARPRADGIRLEKLSVSDGLLDTQLRHRIIKSRG